MIFILKNEIFGFFRFNTKYIYNIYCIEIERSMSKVYQRIHKYIIYLQIFFAYFIRIRDQIFITILTKQTLK